MNGEPLDARPRVTIADIDMPFGKLVMFLIKLSLASIPALIVVWIVMVLIMGVLSLLFGGFGMWMGGMMRGI